MNTPRLSVLPGTRAQIRFYCEQAKGEPWKKAHDEAMRCYDFENLLGIGVSIFRSLMRVDLEYRTDLYSGKGSFSKVFERDLLGFFRWWLRPCDGVEAALRQFESLGYRVAHAEEFRKCCREAKGILTPDEKFFDRRGLEVLAREAEEARAQGTDSDLEEFLRSATD